MRRLLCLLVCSALLVFPCRGEVYTRASTEEKLVALTFDDGPHFKYTVGILDILQKYGVHATFFVIGVNAEKRPDTVRRISEDGHEIGNHTYSHPHLKSCDYSKTVDEITAAEKTIIQITGSRPKLFRPPEGVCSANVKKAAESCGYSVILWSQDTRDWAHTPSSKISSKLISEIHAGDIVLFHDFITPDTPTPDALEKIIPALLEQGFTFVTVSELIA